MALVPFAYNWRSLFVRRSSTLLTVFSIGATVAAVSSVFALQAGFASLFLERGRTDLAVVLRFGASSEGQSAFTRETVDILTKGRPEFATDSDGQPLASAELYLAVRRRKTDGGETNVPLRGVQPATFAIQGDDIQIVDGRNFEPGADEVIVGERLVDRFPDTGLGDVLTLNLTPFRVVGVFRSKGAYASEIWGDVERLREALERPVYNRVIGVLKDGATVEELQTTLDADRRFGAQVFDERSYLTAQTGYLTGLFGILGNALLAIMGAGAIFTGLNAMYSSIAARGREVGILMSVGFRPFAIFVSFLLESGLIGLFGGIVGVLLVLPIDGLRTGTTNFQTFSEVAFSFRITPGVILRGLVTAIALGLIGGAFPAWRAARMEVTEALRRH
jgi:putative ABC transport system permease protein